MTRRDLVLAGGRVVDPVNRIDRQDVRILVRGGKIYPIEPSGSVPDEAEVLDCTGQWIVPGLVDMHVHLREPGEEYKETVESGSRAAAAGGFTALACMPNTKPVVDTPQTVALILEKARKALARVYPVGALSKGSAGEQLAEYGEMKEAGIVALSDDGKPVGRSQLMRRALEYAKNFGLPVISHAEDLSLSQGGMMNEGALSTRLGLKGIPRVAEEAMVYRDIALAAYTNSPIHIAHMSTRESVDLVRRAKAKGIRVTAETAPHYFSLTEEAVEGYATNAKMNPPLRTEDDRVAIQDGLRDGTIDVIASDHAPHSELEKDVEFALAANGIIGLETMVPLSLALVRAQVIDVRRFVELLSVNPARILNVIGGSLGEGRPADLTVIDPGLEFVYTLDTVVSKSKNSPFIDQTHQGKAVLTIMDGRITFRDAGR